MLTNLPIKPCVAALLMALPFVSMAQAPSKHLSTINVEAERTSQSMDRAGEDAVYDANYSSEFAGSKYINVYRGTSPSDLLRNFTGVYSGDARNGGAIDPNVRGIQGPGRVPVTVDGTEQAMTVSRGYNGASNRNYIDPMLIGRMRVVKDGGILADDPTLRTGTGGGIEVKTIDADDVLQGRQGWGAEVRVEGSSNSLGFRNIPNLQGQNPPQGSTYYGQKLAARSANDEINPLTGRDVAGRLAVAYKADRWSVLGAVAYRQRGNYFSGKNHTGYYRSLALTPDGNWDQGRSLVYMFAPGHEVTNTSLRTRSYLLKASAKPTDAQKIELSVMRIESTFGDILPTQIVRNVFNNLDPAHVEFRDLRDQIPLSTFNMNAASLQYRLHPRDNRWVDLKLGLWTTLSSGYQENRPYADYLSFDNSGRVMDTSRLRFTDNRFGLNIANTLTISPRVHMTVFGSLEPRKYKGTPAFNNHPNGLSLFPSEGRSQVNALGLNFNLAPNDAWDINVGARYSTYRLHDEGLEKLLAEGNAGDYLKRQEITIPRPDKEETTTHKLADVKLAEDLPSSVYNKVFKDIKTWSGVDPSSYYMLARQGKPVVLTLKDGTSKTFTFDRVRFPPEFYDPVNNWLFEEYKAKHPDATYTVTTTIDQPPYELGDASGKLRFADNPCFNGEWTGEQLNECKKVKVENTPNSFKPLVVKKGHALTPSITIAFKPTDTDRLYALYHESVRYPDILENTVMYSGTINDLTGVVPTAAKSLKPEHSHLFEIGYVKNLQNIFPNAEAADFRIDYYHNRITDVIDRMGAFSFVNLSSQTLAGLELNARYDSGKWFGSIGANYVLKNQVCDEDSAVRYSMISHYRIPICVYGGLPWGFLGNQTAPRFSLTLNLGTRLLDRKLELGSRMTYYTAYRNPNSDLWTRATKNSYATYVANLPYTWGNTLIFDAYARYKFNPHFEAELSVTNLTDQYYLDPASRSMMPAPGRTVKLSLIGRF